MLVALTINSSKYLFFSLLKGYFRTRRMEVYFMLGSKLLTPRYALYNQLLLVADVAAAVTLYLN